MRPPSGGGQQFTPKPPPEGRVTHSAAAPFAATAGDFTFVNNAFGIGASATGIRAIVTKGDGLGGLPVNFAEWALTSTGSGPSASALAVAPVGAVPDGGQSSRWAFFLPTARAQVGAVVVTSGGVPGALAGEAVLAADLSSMFASAIEAPAAGSGADAFWVVDSLFGPGSAVRAYEYASFDPATKKFSEKTGRRFTPVADDFDGDGNMEDTSLGKLSFADGGNVGLVSFSFLAPGPAGAAGGVFAFDPTNGVELGRIVMPLTSSVTGALEFVGSVRATRDRVVVISAQKGPGFEDLGGRVAVYQVTSWSPFVVVDQDAGAPFDQPQTLVATTGPNPIALGLAGSVALVVDAPFFGEGTLDLIDVAKAPAVLYQSVALGPPYTMGFSVPNDPEVAPDGSQALIGTEAGLIRVELVEKPR